MVCLGNICRSPLAEGIMLKLIDEKKANIEVDSAGTSNYHIGEMPDARTIANALKHKIDLTPLRARQFIADDFDNFDLIYVMDESNKANVLKLAVNDAQKQKVKLFLSQNPNCKTLEVPDPYFGGEQGFENVFQMVYDTCKIITTNYL